MSPDGRGPATGLAPGMDSLAMGAPNHWVTVFGFPGSMQAWTKSHLEHLSGGTIRDQKVSDGNHMHVRFAEPRHAKAALDLNGHEVRRGILLGVAECKQFP